MMGAMVESAAVAVMKGSEKRDKLSLGGGGGKVDMERDRNVLRALAKGRMSIHFLKVIRCDGRRIRRERRLSAERVRARSHTTTENSRRASEVF
jgi:hypothetical protein